MLPKKLFKHPLYFSSLCVLCVSVLTNGKPLCIYIRPLAKVTFARGGKRGKVKGERFFIVSSRV
jgi:hypothetical protein